LRESRGKESERGKKVPEGERGEQERENREEEGYTVKRKSRILAISSLISSITLARACHWIAAAVATPIDARLPRVRAHVVDVYRVVIEGEQEGEGREDGEKERGRGG